MIARERRSTGHRRYGRKSGLRIERLEDRTLLSSTAANVFAQFPGVLSSPGDTQQISIALHAADFTLGPSGKGTLGFQIEPAAGGSLGPARLAIKTGQN